MIPSNALRRVISIPVLCLLFAVLPACGGGGGGGGPAGSPPCNTNVGLKSDFTITQAIDQAKSNQNVIVTQEDSQVAGGLTIYGYQKAADGSLKVVKETPVAIPDTKGVNTLDRGALRYKDADGNALSLERVDAQDPVRFAKYNGDVPPADLTSSELFKIPSASYTDKVTPLVVQAVKQNGLTATVCNTDEHLVSTKVDHQAGTVVFRARGMIYFQVSK